MSVPSSTFVAASGDGYERVMGRWSRRLAPLFLDFAGSAPGERVLDVIAEAGGPRDPAFDVDVQLVRRSRVARARMQRLIDDRARRRALGLAAKTRARAYSVQAMAEGMMAVYGMPARAAAPALVDA